MLQSDSANSMADVSLSSDFRVLVYVGYQRPELMRDANSNHGRPVGGESCSEGRLDLLCRISSHSGTAKCLGGCDDIESGQIKRGHIGGFSSTANPLSIAYSSLQGTM